MMEKDTKYLEEVLTNVSTAKAGKFLVEQSDAMVAGDFAFAVYMKEMFLKKKITQQRVFIDADIPERYGYKLLSGEKRTRQRDVILRICYAAGFTLTETQKALKLYELPQLYVRIPRDALLMIAFNNRPGNVLEVNAYLRENGVEILRSCGVQE